MKTVLSPSLQLFANILKGVRPARGGWLTLLLLGSLVLVAPVRAEESEARPNIIVIVADDLNAELGFLGADHVKTPNLDALASRGVAFADAYSQSPLCNPSRTSFLSGLRPETHRVVDNEVAPDFYLPDIQFFPEYFRKNGWATLAVGKTAQMGLSNPINERSFDSYTSLGHNKREQKARDSGRVTEVGGRFQVLDGDEAIITDAARTKSFLEGVRELSAGDKPFLAYLGFRLPHFGALIPRRIYDQYPAESIPELPEEPPGHLDGLRNYQGGEREVPPSPETRQKVLEDRRGYYAAITYMDELVGKIWKEMEALGLWNDTIVVFLTDHGMLMGEHGGHVGKGNLLRQAVRTPLIIYAPGEPGNGRVCRRVVELIDLFPTLTELAGLATPPHLEGRSLVPLLRNPEAAWDHVALSTHLRGKYLGRAVTTETWRYIDWEGADLQQLYNLKDDPGEYNNLANDPASQPVINELKGHLIDPETPLQRKKK